MTFIKWITIGIALKVLSIMTDCMAARTDIYQEIFDSLDTTKKKIQFFAGMATAILIWPISVANIIICLAYRSRK